MDFKEFYCKKNYSHYKNSNFMSKFFFLWLNPIVKYTQNKPFNQDMHYNLPSEYKIKNSTKNFNKCLKNNNFNIIKGLLEFINNKILWIICLIFISFINFLNVFLFIKIINLTKNIKNDNEIPIILKKVGYYCIGLLIIEFTITVSYSHFRFYFNKLSLLIKNNIIYLIIKKTWKLSQKGLNKTNDGNIINLIQVDSQKIEDKINYFFFGAYMIFNSIFSLIYTFIFVGWIMFFYVILFSLILFIMKKIIKINYKYEKKLRSIKDNTSSLLKNIFNNIKYIKFNVFENYISKKIYYQKLKEIKILKKMSIIIGFIVFFNWFNPKISFFILIISFKISKTPINKIFPLLRIIYQIENLFIYTPYLIQYFFEMKVTFERIQKFIDIEEENIQHITKINNDDNNDIAISIKGNYIWKKLKDNINKNLNLENENILKKKENNFKLKNIDIEFKKKSLTFILGKIGSGKTSLFYSLLGELEKEDKNNNSKIVINGKISCSPQNYFLQTRSIKKNILFYDKFDENKFNKIINLCFLEEDINLLEKGIDTEIGDQGVNISGGQKARISLARCLYKNRNILILDDPIGALDTDIASNIMKNTITNKLKNTTRIIITHSIQFLQYADNIIFMDEGQIKFNGLKEDFISSDYFKLLEKNINKKDTNNTNLIKIKDKENQNSKNYILKKENNNLLNKFLLEEDKVKIRNLVKIILLFIKKLGGFWLLSFIWFLTLIFSSSIFISTKYIENYCRNNTIISNKFIFIIFLVMVIPTFICGFRGYFIVYIMANFSKKLHNEMIYRILHAKIGEFLDRISIGRLLNRFTKDIYNIEKSLSSYFSYILIKLCQTIIAYFAIIYSSKNLWSIIIVILFIFYCFYTQNKYIKVSKDATRLESITKTPILNLTNEIIKGNYLFKSFNKKKEVKKELKKFIDNNTKNGILIGGMLGWFQIRIGLSNVLIIQLFSYLILIFSSKINKETFSNLNLTIFFILQMVDMTIAFLNSFSNLENNLVSIERCNAFTEIPIENNYFNYKIEEKRIMKNIENYKQFDLISKNFEINIKNPKINYDEINDLNYNKKLLKNGNIKFENISANYSSEINNVLNNISFEIKSKEKIGIIGRTGAGKSSIIKLLTRYLTHNKGKITIDNLDISKLDLKKLRKEIFVLSQEISIFEGTLLENIDITLLNNKKNKFENIEKISLINKKESDLKIKSILEVLEKMGFCKEKLKDGLNFKIEIEGKNLSQGEKQLIIFARAIFSKSKILIFDEATSNIDIKTEKLMLECIYPYWKNKTVIMVAHRLTTLLKCDKIITLKQGTLEDFSSLNKLLPNENSYFKRMLNKYNNY